MTALLRLIALMVGTRKPPVDPGRVKKVLIVDLSFIGDIVMTSVTHRAVRQRYPDASIHILGLPVVERILPLLPMIDDFYTVEKEKRLSQVIEAIRLRSERYDLAVHVNTGLWVNFLVWLTGARLRLGYDYGGRGCFHNVRIPISTRTVKSVNRRRECVELLDRAFNWTSSAEVPALTLPSQVRPVVDALLSSWGVDDGDFLVGIHTNSRQDRGIRCWEEGKFAAVADRLIEQRNAKIVFTDVAADRPYVEPIIAGIGRKDRIVDAMGRTTVPGPVRTPEADRSLHHDQHGPDAPGRRRRDAAGRHPRICPRPHLLPARRRPLSMGRGSGPGIVRSRIDRPDRAVEDQGDHRRGGNGKS